MTRIANRRTLGVHPSYKGGCTVEVGGYIYEFLVTHPNCNQWGYVPQHRLVVEETIGRFLLRDEVVHHKDGNPQNNHPDNLQVVTRSEHMAIHAQERADENRAPITEESVRKALQEHSLRDAAALLHVHTQTLRNRYPELVAPHKRKSPTRIDDPAIWELIREVAADPQKGYREIARQYHISFRTVQRICDRMGVQWVKRTKKGEKHTQYRRKKAIPGA